MPSFLHEFFRSLGDGLLIAFVLATAVEPYVLNRFIDETVSDVMWIIFNDEAPDALKTKIETLASSKRYYVSTSWTVTLDWEPATAQSIVKITVRAESSGKNASRLAYEFNREVWALGSCEGFESRFLEWNILVQGDPRWVNHHSFDASELGKIADRTTNGGVVISEKTLANGRTIRAGANYTMIKTYGIWRERSGYLPLVHGIPSLSDTLVLEGDALDDLEVGCFFGETLPGDVKPIETMLDDGSVKSTATLSYKVPDVVMPGQALIVWWMLKPLPSTDPAPTVASNPEPTTA